MLLKANPSLLVLRQSLVLSERHIREFSLANYSGKQLIVKDVNDVALRIGTIKFVLTGLFDFRK